MQCPWKNPHSKHLLYLLACFLLSVSLFTLFLTRKFLLYTQTHALALSSPHTLTIFSLSNMCTHTEKHKWTDLSTSSHLHIHLHTFLHPLTHSHTCSNIGPRTHKCPSTQTASHTHTFTHPKYPHTGPHTF